MCSVGLRIGEAGYMFPHSPLTYVAVHLELPTYPWPFGTTDNGIFLSLELTVIIVLLIAKAGLICEVSRSYLSSYPSFPTLPFFLPGAYTSSTDRGVVIDLA